MRFCTTHRACEVETFRGDVCAVAIYNTDWKLIPCALVDALIVTKEDGKWPEWATSVKRWEHRVMSDGFLSSFQLTTTEYLDALARAEP